MALPSSAIPTDTAEELRSLQDRIGRLARMTFFISNAMLFVSLVLGVTVNHTSFAENFLHPARLAHFGATLLLLAVWRLCAGKSLPAKVLQGIDAGLTILLGLCWAFLGHGVDGSEAIEFSIILATTHTLISRSVLIPSSFARTIVISCVAAFPTIVVFARRRMSFMPNATERQVETFLVFSVVWLVLAIVTAGLNSRQLYGLRKKIREIGKLGQYTLEAKLGEGGMGVVYRATHAMLRRPAAIKLLLPDRTGKKELARFEREVQLTSRLAHPNTVSIFDYGRTADGVFYYVMEYLEGLDLEKLVDDEGPLDEARVIRILVQVSGALAEAHALGLIHRDIKPANVMLTERPDEPDVVKVVDFGLVKAIESDPDAPALSNTNVVTGTPMYLAPEAIVAPDTIDGRSDLYAVGAVAYFLLTAQHVFGGKTILEVCSKHIHEAPVPPSARANRPIRADLEALVLRCLAKKPEGRPGSAAELKEALLACEDAPRYDIEAARRWWKAHGPETRTTGSRRPSSFGSAATMAIDLGRRDLERSSVASS